MLATSTDVVDAPMLVPLATGDRVRITSGSLSGLEGLIVARRGSDRLLIELDVEPQSVLVLIEAFRVEPL